MFKKRWVVNVYDVADSCVSTLGETFTLWGARQTAKHYLPPNYGWGPMWEIKIEPIEG